MQRGRWHTIGDHGVLVWGVRTYTGSGLWLGDLEEGVWRRGSLYIGCCQEVGAILWPGMSVNLPWKEERLEWGCSCDRKEAVVAGISTGRGLIHCEVHSAALFGLCLEKMMLWSCFVSLCHGLRCPCLMLMFCEVTYVQQEKNTAAWWAPAQLLARLRPKVNVRPASDVGGCFVLPEFSV